MANSETLISRRHLLRSGAVALGTALIALKTETVFASGEPDKKAREEYEKEKAQKEAEKKEAERIEAEKKKQNPAPVAAPAATPVSGTSRSSQAEVASAPRSAATVIAGPDLGHPMPTFGEGQLLKLNPDQIAKRAVQLQNGRVANSLDVKVNNYSGEPAIFQRQKFMWGGREWDRTNHEVVQFANWSPWITRAGLRSPHEVVGPKFDQFMKDAHNTPTDLTGELTRNRERILREEQEAGGDVTGTGHCYAQAAFLALERNWNDGFYNPEMSSVKFTWEELGQLGTLMYSSRLLLRDINEGNFDPGTPKRAEADRHNVQWALKQAVENNQPIVMEKPLTPGPTNWWRVFIGTDGRLVTISKFGNEPEDVDLSLIRQAGRPVDPASIEAKHPSVVDHKSYLTYRDQSALSRYPSLEDHKRHARFLLWNEAI